MNAAGVWVLDVGHGSCCFVLLPGGTSILVDCKKADVASEFAKRFKIKHLDAVVGTHTDLDHVGGLVGFLREFLGRGGTVERIYIDRDRPAGEDPTHVEELLEYLNFGEHAGWFGVSTPEKDRNICAAHGWRMDFILPWRSDMLIAESEKTIKPNKASAAVRLSHEEGPASLLICGDAEAKPLLSLTDAKLQASVVVAPHHGGNIHGDVLQLYERIGPKLVVASTGSGTKLWSDHVDAVGSVEGHLMCTTLVGTCGGDGARACGGHVEVKVRADDHVTSRPSRRRHQLVVDTLASAACRGKRPLASTRSGTPPDDLSGGTRDVG
jgi:hypothetical protein